MLFGLASNSYEILAKNDIDMLKKETDHFTSLC